MLSKEEMIDVLNFFNEAHRKVDGKDFDAALNVVDRFTEDLPNKNVSNREYLAFLIEHIRWLREELDKTQEGKLEFDNRAKKVVTSINRLLLTIAHLVGRLNLEKSIEDSYFAKINGEFSPIFTHIPEEREGFASFLSFSICASQYLLARILPIICPIAIPIKRNKTIAEIVKKSMIVVENFGIKIYSLIRNYARCEFCKFVSQTCSPSPKKPGVNVKTAQFN